MKKDTAADHQASALEPLALGTTTPTPTPTRILIHASITSCSPPPHPISWPLSHLCRRSTVRRLPHKVRGVEVEGKEIQAAGQQLLLRLQEAWQQGLLGVLHELRIVAIVQRVSQPGHLELHIRLGSCHVCKQQQWMCIWSLSRGAGLLPCPTHRWMWQVLIHWYYNHHIHMDRQGMVVAAM
jgi:hypothetical protein